jgi:hypothetical protein
LANLGVRVLGIGDEQLRADSVEARALFDFAYEPRMGEYATLRQLTKGMVEKHGHIDRIDSNGEHWLVAEAQLRDDFDVPGLRSRELARQTSKLDMADLFAKADVAYPPTVSASDASAVRKLAAKYGFPLVFKPERGSGAVDTFTVDTEGELSVVLEREPWSKVVQPFVEGEVVTYDGLADRDGRIVLATSHVYDTGIMQVRRQHLDGHYLSLRAVPGELEAVGRRVVAAFDVRERFFHLELFRRRDGGYTALEMNLRPPGGFTTDMINAAGETDVYELWAKVLTGADVSRFEFNPQYHTAHAGRRAGRRYSYSDEQLRQKLGSTLFRTRGVPAAFAATMGDTAYLLRHRELDALKDAIKLVQAC